MSPEPTAATRVYLEISMATAISGEPIQVNICTRDDNGSGHGHRIAGPKYGGSGSQLLKRVEIDAATAKAIRSYLDLVATEAELREMLVEGDRG